MIKRLKLTANKIYLNDILDDSNIDMYGLNTDYGNRDFAITYINGEILSDQTHKDCVDTFLRNKELDSDEYLDFSEGFVTESEQESIDIPMGFASYVKGNDGNDYIAIYPDTLYNVSLHEFSTELKDKYNNAIICIDENDRYEYYNKDSEVYISKI